MRLDNAPAELDLTEVARRLELSDETARRLAGFDHPSPGAGPVLPDDATAERRLEELGVDPEDRASTLAARPDPHTHPAHWWVLDRLYRHQHHAVGRCLPADGNVAWPALPAGTGAVGMHLYIWLILALLPELQRHHRERRIPDEVVRPSLTLDDPLRAHRAIFGIGGLGRFDAWSPAVQLRGAQYRLGRLEFHRAAVAFGTGECGYALGVHIPGGSPLDPAACDRSIATAREFFARHFPEEPTGLFTCESWLMDPQLAERLPESSNIVRFQRRFQLLPLRPDTEPADETVLRYLFGRTAPEDGTDPLAELSRDSTLRRAYIDHLRTGGHWYERIGWFPYHR